MSTLIITPHSLHPALLSLPNPMAAPTANSTDLTDVDRTYLRSCVVNYRSTPPAEKEAFRANCVNYILRQRGVSETDPYALQFIRLVSIYFIVFYASLIADNDNRK